MIEAYFRPKDLDEAIALLSRSDGVYQPLGGGVTLSQKKDRPFSVVDLQALGLDKITQKGQFLTIGATTKLQALAEYEGLQPALKIAVLSETNINLRQQATVAGALLTAGGRSPLAVAMLALDGTLTWQPGSQRMSFGEWLVLRQPPKNARLVTEVEIPLHADLSFKKVARTPDDLPVLSLALARWPSGRVRISLGGFGSAPILALDAPESGGVEEAVRDALSIAEDAWGTAAYRQDVGVKLVRRMLKELG